MKDGRWRVVDDLLGAALEREPHERTVFLQGACGDDEALRREVESLLAHHSRAGEFLEGGALEMAELAPTAEPPQLSVGLQFGSYRILGLLGSGGMGEVYLARDTQLNREVALKILPDSFSTNPERLARFQREAEILASLNDPHIAGIHGVQQSDGIRALVLELVEGETLAQRIARGPIPLSEALPLASQIAAALDTAHEHGIVHRDLKPANIKITGDGVVKILDFGLAKLTQDSTVDQSRSGPVDSLARIDPATTLPGILLGTAAYMSPEQARGAIVDRRADVWAFGTVLYEMVTGQSAFARDTAHDTLAAILKDEPDWSKLGDDTPPRIRRLLELCLAKDTKCRVRDMATVRMLMEGAFDARPSQMPAAPEPGNVPRGGTTLPWVLAIVMGLVAAVAVGWSVRPVATQPAAHLIVPVLPERLDPSTPALSPDGRYLAYIWGPEGARTLSLHMMSEPDRTLASFRGASHPFFSPDSAWLGFFAEGELRKVSVRGGPAQTLARAPAGRGASWGDDDRIVFAPSFRSGLARVSADGLQFEMLTIPDPRLDESGHRLPHVVPGARGVIFIALRAQGTAVVARSLETGEQHVLIDGAQFAKYVATGHLVYVQAGRIMAVPFDVDRLTVTGSPVPLFDTGIYTDAFPAFAVAETGLLVYRSGLAGESTLVWVDRAGLVTPLRSEMRGFLHPRVSPDGRRLVAARGGNLWVYDVALDVLSQLTFDGGNIPLFTPDSRHVIYGKVSAGTGWDIFWKPADGSGSEQGLVTRTLDQVPSGGSPSASGQLAFGETSLDTASDIWLLSMKDRAERVFLRGPANEVTASFSPDEQFIAYVSNELGGEDVFIRPLKGTGGVRRVSYEGGVEPHWASSGELFFRNKDQMMVADVTTQPQLTMSAPRRLFEGAYILSSIYDRNYDVTRDGQRFLMVRRADPTESTVRLNVVVNWTEVLKEAVR